MNKETQKILKQVYSCPEPKRKIVFLETLRPRNISIPEFVLMQVAYIRKLYGCWPSQYWELRLYAHGETVATRSV